LLTDESYFELNRNNTKEFHFNSTVMVWAGISYYGKTSIWVVDGILDAEGYQDLLEDVKPEKFSKTGGGSSSRMERSATLPSKRLLPHRKDLSGSLGLLCPESRFESY